MTRHFGWDKPPKAFTAETTAYLLDRALRAGTRRPRFDLSSHAEQGFGA
jgi:hypothetical protein